MKARVIKPPKTPTLNLSIHMMTLEMERKKEERKTHVHVYRDGCACTSCTRK